MSHRSTLARLGAVTASAGLITLATVGAASAHVTVTPSETGAAAYTVLTFSVPHGCDGSPTTRLDVQIPEELASVTPTRNPYYDISTKTEKLDPPLKAEDGDEITERTSTVTYTARTPLPADERDTFELSLQLPDASGESIAFPVIQTCEEGRTAWTEIPSNGQSEEDLEHPAPAFEITEASSADGHAAPEADSGTGVAADSPENTSASSDQQAVTDSEDDDGNGLAIAGLVTGVLGILVGGAALARSGRRA